MLWFPKGTLTRTPQTNFKGESRLCFCAFSHHAWISQLILQSRTKHRHAVQAKAMNPAFSKIAPVSGGPVDLVMRANSFKAPVQRAGVGISHSQRHAWILWTKTYHILSVLHLGDKPIFQLAEAAFSVQQAVGSWDPISSCPRGPLSQRFGRTRPVISVGLFPDCQLETRHYFRGSMDWIEGHLFPVYISKYIYIL